MVGQEKKFLNGLLVLVIERIIMSEVDIASVLLNKLIPVLNDNKIPHKDVDEKIKILSRGSKLNQLSINSLSCVLRLTKFLYGVNLLYLERNLVAE